MLIDRLNRIGKIIGGKDFKDLDRKEIYWTLISFINEDISNGKEISGEKRLYYISAEFLIGRLLSSNIMNLGYYDEINGILKDMGTDISEIEEVEEEPSLGNGGLGRLAACYLDSISWLNLNGVGVGLNYHFGLFKQSFKDNKQMESADAWQENYPFLQRTSTLFPVEFGKFTVKGRMYDIPVIGMGKNYSKLHVFDLEEVKEDIVKDGINFDKKNIENNLTLFLYPDDSDEDGKKLRVYQQYFMVSCAVQLIIKELKERGKPLDEMDKYAQVQINDTHPSMVIPELVRVLTNEGIEFEKAAEIVSKTCNYTNHTILAEALEKWPVEYFEEVCPKLLEIIKKLDGIIKSKYKDESLWIIRNEQVKTEQITGKNEKETIVKNVSKVHMASLAIHFSKKVNGVAQLHTNILINEELKEFASAYESKFINVTNGITFRRWLGVSNLQLSKFIGELIGDEYNENPEKLRDLLKYVEDGQVLKKLEEIKINHKKSLANYIFEKEKKEIDPNAIMDVQIKRLHEYKRQQMNALYVIYKYFEIKEGRYSGHPITVLFGAKAAPAYKIAKSIIHLILCLEKLINSDRDVNKYLRVIMTANYNVSYAQRIIPATEISEQISLASKEASGTGNMKMMLNGAVTLATMDGANVEIENLVGRENIYIFGKSSDKVIELYEQNSYVSKEYYKISKIKKLVDFIISDEMLEIGDKEVLEELHNELISKDYFMTLLDLEDYIKVKDNMIKDYENRNYWNKIALTNIANAGFFSSDRSIKTYNEKIWKL